MGTILKIVEDEDKPKVVNNRRTFYNYVVYLPVRNEDGTYKSEMALIAMSDDVNVGYMELTTANIVKQAFKSLGNTYGWGGMLNSNDCSGYMRDVYKCFGFELPRNTSWQKEMKTDKYDMKEMSDEEKERVLDTLPVGTILFFKGHEMMYIGNDNDKYYTISAVGAAMDKDDSSLGTFGSYAITTTDTVRMNGKTWIECIDTAVVPFSVKKVSNELFTSMSKTKLPVIV